MQQQLSVEAGLWEAPVINGPAQYARRLTTYIADPARVRSLTMREYGEDRTPSLATIAEMRAKHERRHRPRSLDLQCELEALEQRAQTRAEVKVEREAKEAAELAARREQQVRDAEAVMRALGGYASKAGRIVGAVSHAFGVSPADIVGKSRLRKHVVPRKVAVRLLRDRQIITGKLSLPDIGRIVGDRDHSTIKHSLDTFDTEMRDNPAAFAIYNRIRELVR